MTPDRLNELRRQRALVQQQLDWFDREIAAATPVPSGVLPASPVEAPMAAPVEPADYTPDPEGARLAAKRGCLISAAIILALMTVTLVAIYYWRYRDRPLLFAPAKSVQIMPETPRTAEFFFVV